MTTYKVSKSLANPNIASVPGELLSDVLARPLLENEFEFCSAYMKTPQLYGEWDMEKSPLLPYRRVLSRVVVSSQPQFVVNGNVHWGQMKLLLSEIEFLAWCQRRFGRDCFKYSLVVYAGAADGQHIPMLCQLFPDLRIRLYDPSMFSPAVVQYARAKPDRMRYYNRYFTDEICHEYAPQRVFFISDIRRVPQDMSKSNADAQIDAAFSHIKEEDHAMQAAWVQIMQPRASMLKFAPRYPDHDVRTGEITPLSTPYYGGHIRTQAFPPLSSTETRLIFSDVPPMIDYDCVRFEQIGAYHNNIVRPQALTPSQFMNRKFVNDARDAPTVTGIIFDRIPEPSQMSSNGAIWQFIASQPRYDDWRMLDILRTYVLTQKSSEVVTGGAFDALPASVVAKPQILIAATGAALRLMAELQTYLKQTQLQKLETRSLFERG